MRHQGILATLAALTLLAVASAGWSADADSVNRAIDRGVVSLKAAFKAPRPNAQSNPASRGYAHMSGMQTGVTGLATLTLLECGIPVDDPIIQKQLSHLRQASTTETHTYSLAVLILLFDRVGDADDVALIHSMALRLLGGQTYAGGWSYNCPSPEPDEVKRLANLVKERSTSTSGERRPTPADGAKPWPLPDAVQDQLKRLAGQRTGPTVSRENFQGRGDNSNSQFAILGLWIARRHGIPIGPALAAVETRFRNSQHADGGWGYVPALRSEVNRDTGTTASMTCAALMMLSMSQVMAVEAKAGEMPNLARDPAIRSGFAFLAGGIGQPLGPKGRIMPRTQGFNQTGYYYLWSLERVGVGYNLKMIGNKDWYAWGSDLLVASQESDGCWQHEYGPAVDTCFALLFLKRVNLVKDLTKELKGLESLGEATSTSQPAK